MTFAKRIEDFEYAYPYHICLVVDFLSGYVVEVKYAPFPDFNDMVWEGGDHVHAILKGVSKIIGCSTTMMTIKTFPCDDIGAEVAVIGGEAVKKWMEPDEKPEEPVFHPYSPKSGDEFMIVKVEKIGDKGEEDKWQVLECNDIPGCIGAELCSPFPQNAVVTMVHEALLCYHKDLRVRLLNSNWEKGQHDVQVWGDPVTAYLSVLPRSGATTVTKEEVAEAARAALPPKAILGTQWAHKDANDIDDVHAVAPPWHAPASMKKVPRYPKAAMVQEEFTSQAEKGKPELPPKATREALARERGASLEEVEQAMMDDQRAERENKVYGERGPTDDDVKTAMDQMMENGIPSEDFDPGAALSPRREFTSNAEKRRWEKFEEEKIEKQITDPLERAMVRSMVDAKPKEPSKKELLQAILCELQILNKMVKEDLAS